MWWHHMNVSDERYTSGEYHITELLNSGTEKVDWKWARINTVVFINYIVSS